MWVFVPEWSIAGAQADVAELAASRWDLGSVPGVLRSLSRAMRSDREVMSAPEPSAGWAPRAGAGGVIPAARR